MAVFTATTSKKDDLSGFFVNKIDSEKGELKLSSYKDISVGMLGKSFEDDSDADDDTKEEKKSLEKAKGDDDDDDQLPNNYTIRSVDINPADNSIIITSEVSQYRFYSYTNSSYNSMSKSWTYTTYYVHEFTNKDILVIDADKDGNIKWMNDIPKSQLERVTTSHTGFGGLSFYNDYFYSGGMPFYSSYISMLRNNSLILFLNDHESNNVIGGYGDKVKTIYNFRKRSDIYGVSIDLSIGKMTKKVIAENSNDAVLMPKNALIVNNELYVPSWRMHALAKTQLKFAKISVK